MQRISCCESDVLNCYCAEFTRAWELDIVSADYYFKNVLFISSKLLNETKTEQPDRCFPVLMSDRASRQFSLLHEPLITETPFNNHDFINK